MNGDQSFLEKRNQEKQRNNVNNQKAVQAAANVAESSGHPVAAAIGKGVKTADKLSGGKASVALGKQLSTANKLAGLKGRIAQKAINKLGENGTSERIAQAKLKGNSSNLSSNKNLNLKSGLGSLSNKGENLNDTSLKETEEKASDGGHQSFQVTVKAIKWALILFAPFMTVIVFCCLIMTSANVYLEAIGIGNADKLRENDSEVEEKINKKEDEGFEGVQDEETAFDIFINDSKSFAFSKNKFVELNVEKVAKTTYIKGKYNEADLNRIEDFYPSVKDLSKNYDENMVYDFYYKMYKLYTLYRDKYNVILDLPLLMSTLNIQSKDKYVIFSSNLSPEDRKKNPRKNYDDMDYYYNWGGYITNRKSSTHDMEVLAQHMVSEAPSDQCDEPVNSKCYVLDLNKYRNFLKEFIEKKYYLDGDFGISESSNTDKNSQPSNGNDSNSGNNDDSKPNNNSSGSSNDNIKNGNWKTWTQCGQSWSSMIVPKSNLDMCNIGCLITSVTIQIARSGTATLVSPIDPGIALNYYSFIDGGYFVLASTTNLAPNFTYLSEIYLTGMNKKSVSEKLNSYNSSKYYIILAVSRLNESSVSHYVAFDYADASTNNIYMMDPVSTENKDLYSIYKVYSAYIYEKRD